MDGINIHEDARNRSCVTSVISLVPVNQIHKHNKVLRLIPEDEVPQLWIRRLIQYKGLRVIRFWQKKLLAGYIWGEGFT